MLNNCYKQLCKTILVGHQIYDFFSVSSFLVLTLNKASIFASQWISSIHSATRLSNTSPYYTNSIFFFTCILLFIGLAPFSACSLTTVSMYWPMYISTYMCALFALADAVSYVIHTQRCLPFSVYYRVLPVSSFYSHHTDCKYISSGKIMVEVN